MKYVFALTLFLAGLTINHAAEACNTWAALSAADKATLQGGGTIRVDDPSPFFWGATYYALIPRDVPTASPAGAAAVFWDLEAQPSYLSSTGLVSFVIDNGEGRAAIRATVTAVVPGPTGPFANTYTQENALYKLGASCYNISYNSNNPNQPAAPGFPGYLGDVQFENTTSNQTLMIYRLNGFPIAPLLGDAALKSAYLGQFGAVVSLHVARMRQGATVQQLARLIDSLL